MFKEENLSFSDCFLLELDRFQKDCQSQQNLWKEREKVNEINALLFHGGIYLKLVVWDLKPPCSAFLHASIISKASNSHVLTPLKDLLCLLAFYVFRNVTYPKIFVFNNSKKKFAFIVTSIVFLETFGDSFLPLENSFKFFQVILHCKYP